jgi:carboxynorspermidine decarboxylase
VKAHTYCVAYQQDEFEDILKLSSHISYNSLNQFHQYKDEIANYKEKISIGIRVNPEFSDVTTELYNPASPYSRLGEVVENFNGTLPEGIEGLHFHVLCESTSYALQQVLEHLEEKYGQFFPQLKWINMGGGHLMTRKDYDVDHLIKILKAFKEKHNIQLILEPGSAFAWETGDLVTSVLDVVERRGVKTIIIDASFTAHMPDTLEMPYRPKILGATDPVEGKPTYRRLLLSMG